MHWFKHCSGHEHNIEHANHHISLLKACGLDGWASGKWSASVGMRLHMLFGLFN
jgi:hypothetical protein